jgi:hypothetical protein
LSKVTYPTQGYTEFEYQLHTAYNALLPFTHVIQRDRSLGIQYHLQKANKKTMSDPITINAAQEPTRVFTHFDFPWQDANARPCPGVSANPFRQSMFRYEIWKYTGDDSTFVWKFDTVDDFTIPHLDLYNGTYKIIHTVLVGTNTYLSNMCMPYSFGFRWNETISGHEMQDLGGLRILRMTDASPEVKKVRRYEYLAENGESSGTLMNFPNYSYPYRENLSFCDPNFPGTCGPLGIYTVYTSSSTQPLGTTQGSPVGYGRVTEYIGESKTPTAVGLSGKTITTFTDAKQYPDYASIFNQPVPSWGVLDRFPFAPIDSYDWARGMVLTRTDYALVGGTFVKRKFLVNEYTFYDELGERNYTELWSWKVGVTMVDKDDLSTFFRLAATKFKVRAGYCELNKKTETMYANSGADAPLTTVTDYDYSATHLQVTEQRTTESNGLVTKVKYKYPGDFTSTVNDTDSASVALAKLVNQNRLNKAVEEKVFVNDALIKGSLPNSKKCYRGVSRSISCMCTVLRGL